MADLPDTLYEQVKAQCAEGDTLAGSQYFAEAIAAYEVAWQLLPEPKANWDAALGILVAIADAHFLSEDWDECNTVLQTAVKTCGDALENPFVRLRLGQTLFEMGELTEAANWMAPAFLLEGAQLFAMENPKYLEFVKQRLQPPPGGWPWGW